MRDRWNPSDAPPATDPLGQLVYASRLIGQDPGLVLHGGGNTSAKITTTDVLGEPVDVLYVKGSGWDLADIEVAGFAPLRLARLRALLTLDQLSDSDMVNELRCASLTASAPTASVESLLHALLPHPVALHSHAGALLALTNQPDGRAVVEEVYGPDVVVVPFVMPGFDLARRAAEIVPTEVGPDTVGLVLLNHGLFTFGGDAEEAYRRHIDLISRAEAYLADRARPAPSAAERPVVDPLRLARLRREVSAVAETPMLLGRHEDAAIRAFVTRPDLASVAGRGPATPEHVIRTKRLPLIGDDVRRYAADYRDYVERHRERRAEPVRMLDPAPRVLLDPEFGLLATGRRPAEMRIAYDVYRHTIDIISAAEAIGTYQALSAAEMFDMEYWELEQAKLRRSGPAPEFAGEVALVTGAASGIGRACADALRRRGAAVVGVDIAEEITGADADDFLGVRADVTDRVALSSAVDRAVETFGGLDMVVAAAGIFPNSRHLADLDGPTWDRTLAVNAGSVASLFGLTHPYLALSPRGGRVVLIASRNAPAPGPGAAAYSASKAAAVQVARVAALEWAPDRIRVNVLHPDAVFDTALWTPELIEDRARQYSLSAEQYKRRNLLGTEITSARVGEVTAALCGEAFAATTGAQISVDGGNERVI
ncbi:bifunctional aldolase/short-chain dehydrogenase [Plantactinospora sp. GCM10030261]|uniref:bifunctional aldolase/short-chain dehydrogenase n=1 Tax=Plantactinospora sp. GCM10030261 TaxID=3273420 RepID=UPI00362124EB